MADHEHLVRLTRALMEQGKIIEAGWVGFRVAVGLDGASKVRLNEMRNAFFAGSQHLFGSIMNTLDDGEEPTPADIRRLDLIHLELLAFLEEFKRKHGISPDATH